MQGHGHFKGAHSVHVGCYNGYAAVASFGISEGKAAHQIHLRQAHNGTHSVLYQVCLTGFTIMNNVMLTSLRDFRVLLLGRSRTSLKSSLMSFSIRGMVQLMACVELDPSVRKMLQIIYICQI